MVSLRVVPFLNPSLKTTQITMNLYIINEVLYDYTDGMCVIAAPSLERARELFVAEFGRGQYDNGEPEFDNAIRSGAYKTLQVVGQPEGIVSYVYGGG